MILGEVRLMDMKYWELLKNLTIREIKGRYKQSFLGFFWVLLNPFFQMLIMSFVFSKIIRFKTIGVPYTVFIFAGLLPWIFFSQSVTSSMGILSGNSALLKKIYFPREILILSTLLAKMVDLFLSSLVFIAMLVWFGIKFTPFMLLFFVIFAIQWLFTYSLSLLLSSLNLFYRDVKYLFNLILRLWFYLTPIIYSVEFFPERWRWIFKINPMSVFINAYRKVLLGGDYPNFINLAIGAGISMALFLFATFIFKRLEGTFADVV